MSNNFKVWTGITEQEISWIPVLINQVVLKSQYQVVPTEGYLAWEYNPLRNYRLSQNMYEKDGKYYSEREFFDLNPTLEDSIQKGEIPQNLPDNWTLREAGELVDFITNELCFNINHPVDILPQYSYDGSVNLILNDGLNIPRLINSRFTVTGKNTYKIIDRKGDNDTNIYDQGEQFDVDTSLFKNVNKIPQLEYLGTSTGSMKIGNYHFYFKYTDTDGNESDWVAESGLVSIFIGNSPYSVNTGIRDENSIKSVRFKLSNIDIGYSYVKVYYTRYSADVDGNLVVSAKRIDKNFIITNGGQCIILITGDENETEVTLEEINSSFDVIQNAQTQCSAANRLFMANIHKSKIEYDLLSKLSLGFCPHKIMEPYPLTDDGIDEEYNIKSNTNGYYDTQYIYNKTGYWPDELYRLGIVYILKDGSLSPVFNIRGATNITLNTVYRIEQDIYENEQQHSEAIDTYKKSEEYKEFILDKINEINYSEDTFMIVNNLASNENTKGVIQLSTEINTAQDTPFQIYGIKIIANAQIINELKKYTKGFFFVRQKRMPLTLAQGITIGLDNESRTPTLPTLGGVLSDVQYENTFIETEDLNNINYISEGFLSKYTYQLEKDPKVEVWKKIGMGVAIVAILAAAAVATICTLGLGGVAIGAGFAVAFTTAAGSTMIGTAAGLTTAAIVTAGIAGGAGIIAGVTLGTASAVEKHRQKLNTGKQIPVIGRKEKIPKGYVRKERDDSRQLIQDLSDRYIIKDPNKNSNEALIVPDYQVNQPYYNQFLTGEQFTLKLTLEQPTTNFINTGYFHSNYRHFYTPLYQTQSSDISYQVRLVGIPDGCPVKMIKDVKYCARAGYPEEAYKYEFQGDIYEDTENKIANSDIIRGNFGSYVGMQGFGGHAGDQVNIMIPGYQENKLFDYLQLRCQDTSAFYAISDRIDINLLNQKYSMLKESEIAPDENFEYDLYRGDCYICQYTHRIIRNFNDPSAPYNDKIIDPNTWKENYNPDEPEKYADINLGDVNAIQLGMWLTFQLRSSYNLNIRTIDKSNVDEYLMCGNYRSFYPHYGQLALGSQKIPDSDQYNKGFSKSVSEKYYFEVPDVPYIKQEFQNRIVFSDIHINDAYKNGFRVLRTMNHKDYPMTYGSITKLIEMKNALLIVFEHGIGLVSINNSAEHTSQILSDLDIISDTYGSQWKDSIIKTPSGVYGVDTVAKKIWRVKNGQLELISDLKVQEFLNQNITLTERELIPMIGVRNVKTLYNAFKHDIMFTFYDNLHGTSEKVWNLCWNEMLGIFTTFYSWIPGEMENIDNIPFSFNRDTIKAISKLGISDHGNDFSDGVTLSNNILYLNDNNTFKVNDKTLTMSYLNEQGLICNYEFNKNALQEIVDDTQFIGFLHLDNRILLDGKVDYIIKYELLRDRQKNHELFEIITKNIPISPTKTLFNKDEAIKEVTISYLRLKNNVTVKQLLSELYYRNDKGHSYADDDSNQKKPILIYDANDQLIDYTIHTNLPIFKNKQGKRIMLPKDLQINPDKIVRYLNIKAKLFLAKQGDLNEKEAYYNQFIEDNPCLIDAGYFESSVALTTNFNLSLLSTDFWKHGQAGLIDIADKIYPTYWYGQQHPFEFECIVADNPSVHKIFTNLELVANNVKPESFHYEVVGDVYDFAEDKPTMYFRQEALKALYQYNGYDIEYNPNFLEIQPKQHNRSADFPKYYSRWDTVNEVYDSYKQFAPPGGFNYDHLAGAEIIYYPTRNEFRVWNHVKAIDVDAMQLKKGMLVETSILKANCRYLEDKWAVSINPIIITYKNEFDIAKARQNNESPFLQIKDSNGNYYYKYSNWINIPDNDKENKFILPPINIKGTKLEETSIKENKTIEIPGNGLGKDNSLYELYDLTEWNKGNWKPIDPTKNGERRETDVRGKFIKIRIRYDGTELAIIDFLNTIYQISYA